MDADSALRSLAPIRVQSVADTVFEELNRQILSLELPPGTKVSETEVARALGVSRQPVRDAFFRLSQLGFLSIRPQRATVISPISEAAVRRAGFIRMALEIACWTAAMDTVTNTQLDELADLLKQQKAAVDGNDQTRFHQLDDELHRRICCLAGHEYVWVLIREQKAHMDRVRIISLTIGAARKAYEEHAVLVDALRRSDRPRLEAALNAHLGRIVETLNEYRAQKPEYFSE